MPRASLWCCAPLLSLVTAAAAQDVPPAPTSRPTEPLPEQHRQGGYFGIFFHDVLHQGRSVPRIDFVTAGSDAEAMGFRAGDLILSVDGEPVQNGDLFIQQLYGTAAKFGGGEDREHWLGLLRDGESVRIDGGLDELDAHPKVGQTAPDFTLLDGSGEEEVILSEVYAEQPVFLVFGSYT